MADGVDLADAVSLNRLQKVDAAAVKQTIVADEPGVAAWTGENDASLLLDAEKTAVQKSLQRRHIEQQERQAAEEAEQRKQEEKRQAAQREQQGLAQVRAIKQKARQDSEALARSRATRPIPADAVPKSILHHTGGLFIVLAKSGGGDIQISKEHPRFKDLKAQYEASSRQRVVQNLERKRKEESEKRILRLGRRQARK